MKNIERLMSMIPDTIDAVLITSDINRRYFTGMSSSAGTVLCFRDAFYFIIDFRYIEKAMKCVKDFTVIEQRNLYTQISSLMQQHNAKTLAIESKMMTLYELSQLEERLEEDINLVVDNTLSNLIDDCRIIKSEREINCICEAQRLAETALEKVLNWIHVGVTEREIQLKLDFTMLELGAESLSFPTIALTGSRTSMPHGVPSPNAVVQDNSFVLMDFGAVVDGYHSDMTRTVCIGKPTEYMEIIYNIVLKAQEACLNKIKSGMTGKDIDEIARRIISDEGYGENFGHSLGHGVGMEIHELPNASPSSLAVLQSGNVVTVEPGIYLPDKFGVRIEDFVVVHENGCENLTKAPKKLQIID